MVMKDSKAVEVFLSLIKNDEDIYEKQISVDIVLKIRDEIKFSSIEALKEQLLKDENYFLKLINK